MVSQLWGLSKFDWLAHPVKCPKISPLIVIVRGKFMCNNWGCTSIYQPLSNHLSIKGQPAIKLNCRVDAYWSQEFQKKYQTFILPR